MVEGTTFKTLMLKSYTATMSVEDGKYKVVADIVFSDQGETNVLYSDYAGAVATYTAFYEGFMANIANVINAKKTGGLAAQKSMCESIQLSPEPTAMKAEFSKESGAYSGQAASLGHVDYGYLSQFLNSKSKVYALGEPINYNSAAFGVRQYLPDVEILGDTDGADNGFGGIIFGDEQVCYNPGVSTQIDGLTHFGYKDRFFDGQFTKVTTDLRRSCILASDFCYVLAPLRDWQAAIRQHFRPVTHPNTCALSMHTGRHIRGKNCYAEAGWGC